MLVEYDLNRFSICMLSLSCEKLHQRSFLALRDKMLLKPENWTPYQQCFQRKVLIKRRKYKKLINTNLNQNRLGRSEKGALPFMTVAEPNRKKKISFLPGKGSRNERRLSQVRQQKQLYFKLSISPVDSVYYSSPISFSLL